MDSIFNPTLACSPQSQPSTSLASSSTVSMPFHSRHKLKKPRGHHPTLDRLAIQNQKTQHGLKNHTHHHRLPYLCREKSNESFSCAGISNLEIVNPSTKFDASSPSDLFFSINPQTHPYHYQKRLNGLLSKSHNQTSSSSPRRFQNEVREVRPELEEEFGLKHQVDLNDNLRWLKLINEIERAVDLRPLKPIRPTPSPIGKSTISNKRFNSLSITYFPFPIPPTRPLSINKRPTSQTIKPLTELIQSSDSRPLNHTQDTQSLNHHLPIKQSVSGRHSKLFRRSDHIRQSQELQLGRWDHLLQLERRAREASEEGLRKASLSVSRVSSLSIHRNPTDAITDSIDVINLHTDSRHSRSSTHLLTPTKAFIPRSRQKGFHNLQQGFQTFTLDQQSETDLITSES